MTGRLERRHFLIGAAASVALAGAAAACGADDDSPAAQTDAEKVRPRALGDPNGGRWFMPAEEHEHEATWMCWPSTESVWGDALADVQDAIATLIRAIVEFEPVKLLARPDEVERARAAIDSSVEIVEGPVDDLWARDTLPCFLVATDRNDATPLVAGRARFNGWGGKQLHDGDAELADLVAAHLGIPVLDSGITGEGGGLEVDGRGTVLAARSSWVDDNRNPGLSEDEISAALLDLLGAKHLVWVDGVAGKDITDGHVDTLARFARVGLIVLDKPSYTERGETWYDVYVDTRETLSKVGPDRGGPFEFAYLVQPKHPRGNGDEFLSSYANYYVCNGAVIVPAFGDKPADTAAAGQLRKLYPGREIVQVDIDPIAAGGGGIHCATQQQPKPFASS